MQTQSSSAWPSLSFVVFVILLLWIIFTDCRIKLSIRKYTLKATCQKETLTNFIVNGNNNRYTWISKRHINWGKDEPYLLSYFKLCLYWLLCSYKTNWTQKNVTYIELAKSF